MRERLRRGADSEPVLLDVAQHGLFKLHMLYIRGFMPQEVVYAACLALKLHKQGDLHRGRVTPVYKW